jgi:hypothetical protein
VSGANDRAVPQTAAHRQSTASKKEEEYHTGSSAFQGTWLLRRGHIRFNNKSSYYLKKAAYFQPVSTRSNKTANVKSESCGVNTTLVSKFSRILAQKS